MLLKSAPSRIFRHCSGLAAALLIAVTAARADSKTESAPPPTPPTEPAPEVPPAEEPSDVKTGKPFKGDLRIRMMEDVLRMREFFDTTIPGTLKKFKLVFSMAPRSSDVTRGEFIRVSTLIRYGLRERWEIYGGVTPYVPNPFNTGKEHNWGMGEGRAGVRYNWGHWGRMFDKVTLGLEVRTPLGSPPPRLIDRYSHVAPSINVSRPLPFPDTTLLGNATYDRSVDAPHRDSAPPYPYAIQRHLFILTHSVLYKPGEFGAFVSYSFRHFQDRGLGAHLGHEFKLGPIWDVPLWRTQSWGLPGKWQFELAGRYTLEEGMDADKGISVRVRWRTTIREVFSKKSYQRKPRS